MTLQQQRTFMPRVPSFPKDPDSSRACGAARSPGPWPWSTRIHAHATHLTCQSEGRHEFNWNTVISVSSSRHLDRATQLHIPPKLTLTSHAHTNTSDRNQIAISMQRTRWLSQRTTSCIARIHARLTSRMTMRTNLLHAEIQIPARGHLGL